MQADDTILDAFDAYGSTTEIPDWVFRQIERYVCILYQVGGVSSDKILDLRWILFAQFGKEGQQLPSTIGTLIPHTSRAYYMCVMWKSLKEPCPVLPPATNYYWELTDGKLNPVLCTNSPAPKALLELRSCNCKSGCQKRYCICNKNSLPCTEMCGCRDNCQNLQSNSDRPLETESE